MNLFRTDDDPTACAVALCDRHVVKMGLEAVQIVSTALRLRGVDDPTLYRATHSRHPCVRWVFDGRDNARWTLDHAAALFAEYGRRYGRVHASEARLATLHTYLDAIPRGHTPPPVCVADPYRPLPVHEAYRAALREKHRAWSERGSPPRWTAAERPEWA